MTDKKTRIQKYRQQKQIGGVYTITNTLSGKYLLLGAANIDSAKNRYNFSVATGSCIHPKLQQDWNENGAKSFSFKVLEMLEKKEDQSDKDFGSDLKSLEEIIAERLDPSLRY